jgi:WD40 repeat protein
MLVDGLLITIEINSGEIQRINFDKYFLGKLVSDHVCDVIINRQHIIISYDENIITFVHLQKPSAQFVVQKISATEPKIFNVAIAPNNTKIKRNMAINQNNDILILWTKSSQNEFFPWRPSKDQDRANLHIYSLNRDKIELICYFWTENSPIEIEFSKFNENEVRSIEQKISRKGEVTIECVKYYLNVGKSKFKRIAVTSIPLETEVACCSFSPDHEKILMSCIDGSIILFDERGTTYLVRASFIPTSIAWHPDSALLLIANDRCQVQSFDIALSCIKNQILSEDTTPSNILDLSSYFVQQPKLNRLCWSKKPDINHQRGAFAHIDCFLLLIFDSAIATIKFIGGAGLRRDIHTSGLSPDVFIHLYISLNQIEKAINVLLSLNWVCAFNFQFTL